MNTAIVSNKIALRQRGISLIVVMVMLLLGSMLALGATRTNWLNESLVSNESDYQRAYSAAEALIADAETDIRGVLAGGFPCKTSANFYGCRDRYGGTAGPFIPVMSQDLDDLRATIPNFATLPCRQGICLLEEEDALGVGWWNLGAGFDAMTANTRTANAIAATYGEFTGIDNDDIDNPLLLVRADGEYGAWYWIEVMEFQNTGAMAPIAGNLPVPAVDAPFIFRITAVANGLKPGTRVVLRTIFVPALADPAA
ncbi:pilus assembly PilX family protein [Hydrogenophaga sp. ZJX-1]|uniref:pilus assembly PilX family protein n=1 Tax=Hydrogenophaga sp. ZJX-1 TaxID=3404778 RepID=UPI003B287433